MKRNFGELGNATKYKFFENYIQPFLKRPEKLKGSHIMLFFDLAERAFFDGVGKKDGKVVTSYLNVCEKIYSNDSKKEEIEELFVAVLNEIEYPATYRVNKVIEGANKDTVRNQLEYYTALVENFVRILLTPIYYYAHTYHGKSSKATSPEEYLNIGIIQKVNAIKSISVPLPGIDPSHFCGGLDMRIRHGGTAHEHWEVLDDDKVRIKNISPETGKIKDDFTLTIKELSEKLDELKRLIWSLRVGFYAFLENANFNVEGEKPRTKYSVEQYTSTFAANRLLEAKTPFDWNDAGEISLELKYETPFEVYPGGELILATGVFEIINKIDEHKLKFQVIDVLKYLSVMINSPQYKNYKKITSKVFVDDKEVGLVSYLTSDLSKIDKSKTFIPKVCAGSELSDELLVKFISEITVPKGFKDASLLKLKEKYPESKFV